MSVTLWVNTDKDETVELGPVIPVYKAFARMSRLVGTEVWLKYYPELADVLDHCERTNDDADPEWLAKVRDQAAKFLRQYGKRLDGYGVVALKRLSGQS